MCFNFSIKDQLPNIRNISCLVNTTFQKDSDFGKTSKAYALEQLGLDGKVDAHIMHMRVAMYGASFLSSMSSKILLISKEMW